MQRSCRNNRNCQTSASTGAGHKGVSNLVIAAKHCYQFGLVHSTNGKHAGHCTPHNKQHVKTEDSNMDVSPQTPNTLQRLFPTQLSVRCFSPEGPKQAPGQHRSISAPRTGKHRRRRLRSISGVHTAGGVHELRGLRIAWWKGRRGRKTNEKGRGRCEEKVRKECFHSERTRRHKRKKHK